MKRFTLLACLCLLFSCKKDSQNSSSTKGNTTQLQVQIKNLSDSTNWTLISTNYTENKNYQQITGYHDTIFYFPIKNGDEINVEYNFVQLLKHSNGKPGTGTVFFYYNGNEVGAASNGSGNINVFAK
jgi:hypothetical protein